MFIKKLKKVLACIKEPLESQEPKRGFMVVSKYFVDKKIIKLPNRATKQSAGYDFYNNTGVDIVVPVGAVSKAIPTGIKVYMQSDEVLEIFPRSSLGFKYNTRLANTVGIIDSDYYDNEKNEGEIFVKLNNMGEDLLVIKPNEAFVQGIFKNYLVTDTDIDSVGGDRVGGIGSTSNGEE